MKLILKIALLAIGTIQSAAFAAENYGRKYAAKTDGFAIVILNEYDGRLLNLKTGEYIAEVGREPSNNYGGPISGHRVYGGSFERTRYGTRIAVFSPGPEQFDLCGNPRSFDYLRGEPSAPPRRSPGNEGEHLFPEVRVDQSRVHFSDGRRTRTIEFGRPVLDAFPVTGARQVDEAEHGAVSSLYQIETLSGTRFIKVGFWGETVFYLQPDNTLSQLPFCAL